MQYVKQLIEQITPHFPGTLSEAVLHIESCKTPVSSDIWELIDSFVDDELSDAQVFRFNALGESLNPLDQAVYLYFLYWRSMSLFGPVHYAYQVKKDGENPVIDIVIKDLLDQTVACKGYSKPKTTLLHQITPINVLPDFLEIFSEEPQVEELFFSELRKLRLPLP